VGIKKITKIITQVKRVWMNKLEEDAHRLTKTCESFQIKASNVPTKW